MDTRGRGVTPGNPVRILDNNALIVAPGFGGERFPNDEV